MEYVKQNIYTYGFELCIKAINAFWKLPEIIKLRKINLILSCSVIFAANTLFEGVNITLTWHCHKHEGLLMNVYGCDEMIKNDSFNAKWHFNASFNATLL